MARPARIKRLRSCRSTAGETFGSACSSREGLPAVVHTTSLRRWVRGSLPASQDRFRGRGLGRCGAIRSGSPTIPAGQDLIRTTTTMRTTSGVSREIRSPNTVAADVGYPSSLGREGGRSAFSPVHRPAEPGPPINLKASAFIGNPDTRRTGVGWGYGTRRGSGRVGIPLCCPRCQRCAVRGCVTVQTASSRRGQTKRRNGSGSSRRSAAQFRGLSRTWDAGAGTDLRWWSDRIPNGESVEFRCCVGRIVLLRAGAPGGRRIPIADQGLGFRYPRRHFCQASCPRCPLSTTRESRDVQTAESVHILPPLRLRRRRRQTGIRRTWATMAATAILCISTPPAMGENESGDSPETADEAGFIALDSQPDFRVDYDARNQCATGTAATEGAVAARHPGLGDRLRQRGDRGLSDHQQQGVGRLAGNRKRGGLRA